MNARLVAAAAGILCVFSLTSCNGVGPKESLLAKINDESVYEEDMIYALKDAKEKNQDVTDMGEFLYSHLYSKAALTSKALVEYPSLEKDWKNLYSSLEIRWLTMIYQNSFLGECMGFSDEELMRYYKEHSGNFEQDSLLGYYGVRRDVAGEYYIQKNQDSFKKFLEAELSGVDTPAASDTLKAKDRFVEQQRSAIRKNSEDSILVKRGYKVEPLPPIDPKKFYSKHQDLFMTVPGYELYHVQGSDSAALSSLVPEGTTLEQFKKIAASKSTNKGTASDSGRVGVVKKGYALPYGIGMLPVLDSDLDGKTAGFITSVIPGNDRNVFHRFFLVSTVPSKLKSFDRVQKGIENSSTNSNILDVDSSVVLISKDGKAVLTEADLIKFNTEFVKRPLTWRSHNWLVNMLAEHYAYAEVAKEAKLDHNWEYRALVRSARYEFIESRYMELLEQFVSDEDAKAWFDRVLAKDNPNENFDSSKVAIKAMAGFPENLVKRDYYMGYSLMYKDRPYGKSFLEIFSRRKIERKELLAKRIMADAYSAARVHLYDSSIPEFLPRDNVKIRLERADSLKAAGNTSDAYLEYRTLMFAYAEVDSLFSKALYEMATIRNESNQFTEADVEYYAYYKIFPEDKNAEKAMFSRGFILNENLGKNDLAQEVLEEFIQKYPNSEFRESADWLLENIKSNGKLEEELKKKISED